MDIFISIIIHEALREREKRERIKLLPLRSKLQEVRQDTITQADIFESPFEEIKPYIQMLSPKYQEAIYLALEDLSRKEAGKQSLKFSITYSNCAWQNGTLSAAREVARGNRSELTRLGLQLGLFGYPDKVEVNGDTIDKTAFQYIETQDHPRFICNFRTVESDNELLKEGNRGFWYKVQPYLIGLLTAKGIQLLWQGQEFGENYFLPENGMGRVLLFRPVRWVYFYDSIGQSVVSLVRRLIKVRKQPQFQSGQYMFYNDPSNYQEQVFGGR